MRFFPFGFFQKIVPVTPPIIKGGAINFNANSNITLAGSSDWAVGTGDYTIEWWQYQTNNGTENFIFDLNTNDTFAASIASGGNRLNVYENGSKTHNPTVSPSLNTWYHVALSRISGTLNGYFNGTRVINAASSTNISDSTSTLHIGCENPGGGVQDNWPGYVTNFRWVKGTGLYSGATITVPTTPLTAVANTKLLLLVQTAATFLTDSSASPKTVTNNGSAFINSTPF